VASPAKLRYPNQMGIKENISPLGKTALELDFCFTETQRLSNLIDRTPIDTDADLQLVVKLLNQFTEKAQVIEEVVKQFSSHLERARESSNEALKIVAEKAHLIQKRKQERDEIELKLSALGTRVREVISVLSSFNKADSFSDDRKSELPNELKAIQFQLGEFSQEARLIKQEAEQIKFKDASSSAESLHSTLQTANTKLGTVINTLH
jgi:chromosome segregation ATPase